MLTVNYEYSRINIEKLPLHIQMELNCFAKLNLNQILNILKKNEPHHLNVSEFIDSKRRAYSNA